jgi:hypothetical protein
LRANTALSWRLETVRYASPQIWGEVLSSQAATAKLSFNFIPDIAPIASIYNAPLVMEVNPSLPFKTGLLGGDGRCREQRKHQRQR